MCKPFAIRLAAALAALSPFAAPVAAARPAVPTLLRVELKLDESSYVVGERVRATVGVKNLSPETIAAGREDLPDRLLVELFHRGESTQIEPSGGGSPVGPFKLAANQGVRLETFLADHFPLCRPGSYFARAVLVHDGVRYEGEYEAFDIVDGMHVAVAQQLFSNRPGLTRTFELLRWSRKGAEHLFVAARDEGARERKFTTTDIGPVLRAQKPVISIMSDGRVVIIHRNGPESYLRSEFWSMSDKLEIRTRENVPDPEIAAHNRVREIYNEAGGVQPVDRPWWKFW